MIDHAALDMNSGMNVAAEKVCSVNDNVFKSHYHDFFELFYLNAGVRTVVLGSHSYLLRQDGFIVIPPYTMHHSFSSANVDFARTVVYFRESVLPPGIADALKRDIVPMVISDRTLAHEFRLMLNSATEESENRAPYRNTMLESMANILLIFMLRNRRENAEAAGESKISSIVRYIQGHYGEPLSLDALSERFFISKFHLCREFRSYTNCSVGEYISRIRVLHARRMFQESDLSVTEIAQATGFSSLTSFERVFRKYGGGSPKKESIRVRKHRDDEAKRPRRTAPAAGQGMA